MSLDNIKVQSLSHKKAHFNFGHDTFSTLEFGVMQPVHVKQVMAGSTHRLGFSANVRLSALKYSTYGRIYQCTYAQFVPYKQLFEGFDHFLSQTYAYGHDDTNRRTNSLPTISARLLMWYICKYSAMKYFIAPKSSGPEGEWSNWNPSAVQPSNFESWKIVEGSAYNPVQLPRVGHACLIEGTAINVPDFDPTTYDFHWVHESKSDSSPYHATFVKCFTLGARLYSCFLACGMVPSMEDGIYYQLAPLLAVYKAYFDLMRRPVAMYESWESTPAYRLIQMMDKQPILLDTNNPSTAYKDVLDKFFSDLAHMYYSAHQNIVSAIEPEILPSQNKNTMFQLDQLFNYEVANEDTRRKPLVDADRDASVGVQGYLYQIDVEVLKRLYLMSNTSVRAGKKLAAALRARGYSDFVDEIDSTYLMNTRNIVKINEIISTADTDERPLGDYGGQASEFGLSCKPKKFQAKECGFVVMFSTIVPELRFTNGASEDALSHTQSTFYNPVTDSLGRVGVPRLAMGFGHSSSLIAVNGSNDPKYKAQQITFGVAPNHFLKKICHNLSLGGGALQSQKNTYMIHYLRTDVEPFKPNIKLVDGNRDKYTSNELAGFAGLDEVFWNAPDAGEIWRYFAAYSGTNTANEIFEYGTRIIEITELTFPVYNIETAYVIKHDSMSPMLPTEYSWGTIDDPDNAKNLREVSN